MKPPNVDDLDDEIRGHLALSIQERIERGEDPEAARQAALKEFGNILLTRDSMRGVWRPGWLDGIEALVRDFRFAWRSLLRAKGLTGTVVVTLALGIGANAAIFSVVRTVLLRPLVNRDPDRLVYIRQTAPGIGTENMTFSMPEVRDLQANARTISAFGDFSTVDFSVIGFGTEPRVVTAGVVNGSFFEVMGLRPALGRLVNRGDEGPAAPGVAVLTHRFWSTVLHGDSAMVGKSIRIGRGVATIVGVLEPCAPYPAETQLFANVVTSPHHLGATMVDDRTHRMTELFGRLAPGATLDEARAELTTAHTAMMRENPEAYSVKARVGLNVTTLRDQLVSPARPFLLLLLAAAAIVFVIACSNVANLILGRSVRREAELAVRAALGAGRGALRRTLLAESLLLCAAGAALGLMLAWPLVSVAGRYAARFSIRALESRVDASVLGVGVVLAFVASVLLAFVPRLPSSDRPGDAGLATGGLRMTQGTRRRLQLFATTQIACSFVLLAGAGMLLATLNALQTANTGFEMRKVLAIDLPSSSSGAGTAEDLAFFREATRRVGEIPGVAGVSSALVVPWRDPTHGLKFRFAFEGYQPADGEEDLTCRMRPISPRYCAVLGVPILEGRDFTDDDRADTEYVAMVSRSLAQRVFPNGDAINRHLQFTGGSRPRRIVGIVADVDDENVVQEPTLMIYLPCQQMGIATRLFVRAAGDPYALVPSVTRTIRAISADQAIERPATLEDVRAEVLAPERLNAFVFAAFGGIALLIAVVGVAGVLAFSVSARTREIGVRLAVGATPAQILTQVLKEGLVIVAVGITAGAVFGYGLTRLASASLGAIHMPGALPVAAAAAVLVAAALFASIVPAARASRVDVLQALRSE
jgi:predicted permease